MVFHHISACFCGRYIALANAAALIVLLLLIIILPASFAGRQNRQDRSPGRDEQGSEPEQGG